MDCGRVSPIRSLVELCMKQVVTVCVNSTEPVEMSMNERLVIFEKLQTMHQLRKDTLRILVNEPSRHFLNRYNEVYFSKQPIEDECIQLIYQMLPTESEMETGKKKIQIDLSYCLQLSNPTIIPDTTRDKHSIRGISLRGCKCLKNLDFLRNFCRPDSLQFIDLSQCWSLSSSQIGDIGNFFHKLKGITLNYCSKLEDEDIIKIIENNESLESISLVGCGKITSKTLNVISNMALPLSNLSLGRSRKISIASFLKLLIICGESIRTLRMPPQCKNPWTLISLPYFCPKLNALELENIEMSWLTLLRYPTEQQLAKFVSQATEGTDDESFLFWKEKMEKLFRGLPIDQQHEIGARYLSKLARLNLTSVHWDNEVAEEIFPFCSLLHDVSIHGCRTIGSSTFDGLARSGCKITSLDCGYMLSNCPAKEGIGMLDCTELRYLYCGSSFRDDIIHSWLNKSPNSCVKLKSIQIHWSDNVRDSGMTKLLDRCGKSLLWLEIGLCYFLTVKTFESLASFCPNLLELDIRSIPNVTDEIIDMICIKCPNIEQLNISHDSELTDCAMETIAKNLPRLSSLQLDNLTKITDHGIRTLASFVRERMKCLSVAGIRALTDLSLQYIGNYHPNISSLNLSSTRFSAKGMCNLLNSLHFIQELNLSTQPNVNDQVVACACSNPFLQTLELSECPLLTNDCITSLAKCSRLESLSLANSVNVQGSLLPILERNDGHISLTTPANAALSRW